jgi:hypothetical protein
MPLPNADQAFVPEPKLTDYLLSETHPVGKYKARYFQRYGFTLDAVELLGQRLRRIATDGDVIAIESTPYGTK